MRYRMYFLILGAISTFLGLISVLAVFYGRNFAMGIIYFPSDVFRGGLGGSILIMSGLFYIHGARRLDDIHHRAEIFMGSLIVWIVGGSEILRMILESIPGEDGWINSFEGFLSHYLPPYHPSILILPFSLVVLAMERYYGKRYSEEGLRRDKRKEG